MLCVIDDGPLSDDRKAMHTKLHGKQVTQKWKWVSTGNNLRGGTKTNVIQLTLDWKGLKNICQKGYMRSVVYIYHSKMKRNKLLVGKNSDKKADNALTEGGWDLFGAGVTGGKTDQNIRIHLWKSYTF